MKRHPWIIAALLAWALLGADAPRRGGPTAPGQDPRREWTGRDLQIGEAAPDFALPRLDPFLKAQPGETPKVQIEKLSAWRGKRPVLLIFSSYT